MRAGQDGGPAERRGSALVTGLVALGVVGAVAAGLVVAAKAVPDAARPTLGAATDGSAPVPERVAAPTTSPPAATVTLAFAGDVHFAGRVESRLADPRTTFGPVASVFARADLAMVNLETAITERGTEEPKQFHFRAPESAFAALRAAGIDVATMANNHGADYGEVGIEDSLAAIRRTRFPTVGIGRDAATAYAPYRTTVKGRSVAILGASQVRDRTLSAWTAGEGSPGIASAYDDRLVAAVRRARAQAEIVVVYLHWGVEGRSCPTAEMRSLAARLAGAGADAVVGTHAHLLLGGGWLGRTYVGYGLGNFLWWRNAAFSDDTGVLRLTFRGRQVVAADLAPAEIDERGVPVPVAGAAASRIRAKHEALRECTGLSARPG